jgi:hypothetical protein
MSGGARYADWDRLESSNDGGNSSKTGHIAVHQRVFALFISTELVKNATASRIRPVNSPEFLGTQGGELREPKACAGDKLQ